MYKRNPAGVNYRFKKMLEHLKLETSKKVKGRTAKVSSKGIHSLRHSFCYLHGVNGTPIHEVQQMVGHMTSKMTEYYTLHKSEEAKSQAQLSLGLITNFAKPAKGLDTNQMSREDII